MRERIALEDSATETAGEPEDSKEEPEAPATTYYTDAQLASFKAHLAEKIALLKDALGRAEAAKLAALDQLSLFYPRARVHPAPTWHDPPRADSERYWSLRGELDGALRDTHRIARNEGHLAAAEWTLTDMMRPPEPEDEAEERAEMLAQIAEEAASMMRAGRGVRGRSTGRW